MTLLLLVACTSDPGAPGKHPADTAQDSGDTAQDSGAPCAWPTTYVAPDDPDWLFGEGADVEVVELSVDLPEASADILRGVDDGGSTSACGALTTPHGVIAPVQISLRGKVDNSFQPFDGKPYLQIDVSESGATLGGRTRIRLYNQWQDQSGLQRHLGYKMWRDVGYPAPKTGFATLALDGRDLGVYGTTEVMDGTMLRSWPEWFASVDTIFEGEYGNDFHDVEAFEVKEGTPDWERLHALATVVTESEDLAADLPPHLDPATWWRYWALEVAVGAREGYTFDQNNYFLAYDGVADRFTILPWGFDQVLYERVATTSVPDAAPVAILPTHAMEQPPFYGDQCAALAAVLGEIDWAGLGAELVDLETVLPDTYVIDGVDAFTSDRVREMRDTVAAYLVERPVELAAWTAAGCPPAGL